MCFNSMKLSQIKTVLKKEILDMDLFNLDFLGATHVSERLGEALLNNQLTGMELIPVFYDVDLII